MTRDEYERRRAEIVGSYMDEIDDTIQACCNLAASLGVTDMTPPSRDARRGTESEGVMSRLIEVLMRIMVIVNSIAACVMQFGGYEQRATYMLILAMFSLMVAMDLERWRYGAL